MASEEDTSPSSFETTATYEQTQVDYYQERFDKWVTSPAKILWNDYRGRVGIIIVIAYLLLGTVGVVLIPEPKPNMGPRLVQPFQNPSHILGTDGLGQDLLALMAHATPDMLKMILAGTIFANLLGVSLGLYTGYTGGTTDKVIMTFTDTIMSLPGIPLLIVIVAILEPTNPYLIGIILNITGWAGQTRIIRSQVLPLADEEHVEAAIATGQPKSSLLTKEVLPHLLPFIFIGFLGGATRIITASVGLYFLGLLPFTTQNWGIVLNFAYTKSGALYSLDAAHWLLVPAVTIVGLTVGLTLLAQAFDQVFNPRVRARHEARKQSPDEPEESVADDAATQVGVQ